MRGVLSYLVWSEFVFVIVLSCLLNHITGHRHKRRSGQKKKKRALINSRQQSEREKTNKGEWDWKLKLEVQHRTAQNSTAEKAWRRLQCCKSRFCDCCFALIY